LTSMKTDNSNTVKQTFSIGLSLLPDSHRQNLRVARNGEGQRILNLLDRNHATNADLRLVSGQIYLQGVHFPPPSQNTPLYGRPGYAGAARRPLPGSSEYTLSKVTGRNARARTSKPPAVQGGSSPLPVVLLYAARYTGPQYDGPSALGGKDCLNV
jgi:hypothetical protein